MPDSREITYTEVGVLRDRIKEVTAERDWLRLLVDRLTPESSARFAPTSPSRGDDR